MHNMSAKRCPFCPKVHFLSVATSSPTLLSCPVCEHLCGVWKRSETATCAVVSDPVAGTSDKEDIKGDAVQVKHAFCPECRILFCVDLDHLHHQFDDGCIYLAQTVAKYAIGGRILEGMPQFPSKEVAIGLIDADKIAIEWSPIGPLDECCSCLKPTALATPCGHILCSACKAKWCIEQGRGCPMCRAPVFATDVDPNAATDEQTAAELSALFMRSPVDQLTLTVNNVEHVIDRPPAGHINEAILALNTETFGLAIATDGSVLVGMAQAVSVETEAEIDSHAA